MSSDASERFITCREEQVVSQTAIQKPGNDTCAVSESQHQGTQLPIRPALSQVGKRDRGHDSAESSNESHLPDAEDVLPKSSGGPRKRRNTEPSAQGGVSSEPLSRPGAALISNAHYESGDLHTQFSGLDGGNRGGRSTVTSSQNYPPQLTLISSGAQEAMQGVTQSLSQGLPEGIHIVPPLGKVRDVDISEDVHALKRICAARAEQIKTLKERNASKDTEILQLTGENARLRGVVETLEARVDELVQRQRGDLDVD